MARTLLLCIGFGYGAGWLIPFINLPFIGCIICYFFGLMVGRCLVRVLDARLGNNVGKTIVFGLLIGMSLTPYGQMPLLWVEAIRMAVTTGVPIFGVLTGIVGSLFSPVGFFVGVLRQTIWGPGCGRW